MWHGQFLIMGGICLVEPPETSTANVQSTATTSVAATPAATRPPLMAQRERGRRTILTLEILKELLKDNSFEIRITEEEISDRSRGDGLSKLVFMLQSSWFIVQCIARHIQRLDLTQLELTTLAMASLNGITCLLWWQKPLNARAVLHVYLSRQLTDEERNVTEVSVFFGTRSYSHQKW